MLIFLFQPCLSHQIGCQVQNSNNNKGKTRYKRNESKKRKRTEYFIPSYQTEPMYLTSKRR